MNLGKNIHQLRIKAGLSQDEFAKLLKVSQPNVNRWENNIVVPSIKTVIKIARVLKISADSILFSTKDKNRLKSSNLALSKRLKNIEKLPTKDRRTLFQIIDAFLKSK